MQFTYIKKDGTQGTVDAPDANSAVKMLPADANPRSGVMASLSGTGTPAPGAGAPPTKSLPDSAASGNPLLDFKNAIAKIDSMARKNRNAFVPSLAGAVPEGTLNASSFGDIVSMLNQGGERYMSDTAANALDTQSSKASDIFTTTNDAGVVTAIDKATGETLWKTKPGVGNVESGKDTSSKDKANDIASAILDFKNKMKTYGWKGANPDDYEDYKNQIINMYGAAAGLEFEKAMIDTGIAVDYGA